MNPLLSMLSGYVAMLGQRAQLGAKQGAAARGGRPKSEPTPPLGELDELTDLETSQAGAGFAPVVALAPGLGGIVGWQKKKNTPPDKKNLGYSMPTYAPGTLDFDKCFWPANGEDKTLPPSSQIETSYGYDVIEYDSFPTVDTLYDVSMRTESLRFTKTGLQRVLQISFIYRRITSFWEMAPQPTRSYQLVKILLVSDKAPTYVVRDDTIEGRAVGVKLMDAADNPTGTIATKIKARDERIAANKAAIEETTKKKKKKDDGNWFTKAVNQVNEFVYDTVDKAAGDALPDKSHDDIWDKSGYAEAKSDKAHEYTDPYTDAYK
jgi:hypothetical protein